MKLCDKRSAELKVDLANEAMCDMDGVVVKCPPSTTLITPAKGSAGLSTQVPGAIASVSNLSGATGGIKPGNLVQRDTK